MATVTVDATWRVNRVEISTPYTVPHTATGYGEILLKPVEGEPVAMLKRSRSPAPYGEMPDDPETYGTMMSSPVMRAFTDVAEETVDVDGSTLSFTVVIQALNMFFERWRVEDQTKPPPEPPLPQNAEALTEMPPMPLEVAPVPPGNPNPRG